MDLAVWFLVFSKSDARSDVHRELHPINQLSTFIFHCIVSVLIIVTLNCQENIQSHLQSHLKPPYARPGL